MLMRWRTRGTGAATSVALAGALALGWLAPSAMAGTGPTETNTAASPSRAASSATADAPGRLILRLAGSTSAGELRQVVEAVGGRVVATQPALQMAVVDGPANLAALLRAKPWVTSVAHDAPVTLTSLGYDPATQAGGLTKVTAITGASGMWKAGYTGKGIDVAVIDTGVAPVPGLSQSDKVVLGPDLSFESQSTSTRFLDSY